MVLQYYSVFDKYLEFIRKNEMISFNLHYVLCQITLTIAFIHIVRSLVFAPSSSAFLFPLCLVIPSRYDSVGLLLLNFSVITRFYKFCLQMTYLRKYKSFSYLTFKNGLQELINCPFEFSQIVGTVGLQWVQSHCDILIT